MEISRCQLVIFTTYVLGMIRWIVGGEGSADLKLQCMAIMPIFGIACLLSWLWEAEIGPVQLFNSIGNMEEGFVNGGN